MAAPAVPTGLSALAVLAAITAMAAMPVASTAATDYWAFGDSVTRGQGGIFALDPVLLNDCLTANPYPTKCGYHWRLEAALTLAGITNSVANRGVAGETTGMGKSRIDEAGEPLDTNRCTDPDAGDVVVIMQGTNDISQAISTTTIKANLGEMGDLATTNCVHTVYGSTIRRLKAGTPEGSKLGDPLHPQTSDLATKVSALAGEKNRVYADVWLALCNDPPFPPGPQPCYNAKFWGRLTPDEPGHVSHKGYNVMSPLFETAILADPLPGATTLIAPSGGSTGSTPVFSWNEHADADWYFLEVDSGAGYGRWHPEEEEQTLGVDICTGGVCTYDPAVALADGDHTWRVRTRNLRGVGSWSAAAAFCTPTTKDLPGDSVGETRLESACVEIIAANLGNYTVEFPDGDVTFHAGATITIHNGFTVEKNARFTAIVDP